MADFKYSGPFANLKHRLSNFVEVACFDALDAENVFAWTFDSLKHRIISFN
jgi:hypothetical protein